MLIRKTSVSLYVFCCFAFFGANLSTIQAQTDSGNFGTVFNVQDEASSFGDGESVSSNTQLNLFDGGSIGGILGNPFEVGPDDGSGTNIEFNIFGGAGGIIIANAGSTTNVLGGQVTFLGVRSGATARITGGQFLGGRDPVGSGVTVPLSVSQDASVEISGGEFGTNVNTAGSLNISGGVFGSNFSAGRGSVVNITGGTFGDVFEAEGFSDVNVTISGGVFGDRFRANANTHITDGRFGDRFLVGSTITGALVSDVLIEGGSFGDGFSSDIRSKTKIAGGSFGKNFRINFENPVFTSRTRDFVGGNFELNGEAYAEPNITLAETDVFTGSFADGSTFIFAGADGDALQNLDLTTVALPAIGSNLAVIDSATGQSHKGLSTGDSLTVRGTGVLQRNFSAISANLNIEDGLVESGLEVDRSNVTISGGTIKSGFVAFTDSNVNISGGIVESIRAYAGTIVDLTGGELGGAEDVVSTFEAGSTLNLAGGSLKNDFVAAAGSSVDISGGLIESGFTAQSGSNAKISGGVFGRNVKFEGEVELVGGEFKLNGESYSQSTLSLSRQDVLSGTLQDGSVFIFAPVVGDQLVNATLTQAALPSVGELDIRNSGLREGQKLIVSSGEIIRKDFAAAGAEIEVNGGRVLEGLEVSGTSVIVRAGSVDSRVRLHSGSQLDVYGGQIDSVSVFDSSVQVLGGDINFLSAEDSDVRVVDGSISSISILNETSGSEISGGRIDLVSVRSGTLDITGGLISELIFDLPFRNSSGDLTVNYSGGSIDVLSARPRRIGSSEYDLNIFGTDFLIDGISIEGLGAGDSFLVSDRDVTLSGFLTDGSFFSYELLSTGTFELANLKVNQVSAVPEPSSLVILAFGVNLMILRRRKRI